MLQAGSGIVPLKHAGNVSTVPWNKTLPGVTEDTLLLGSSRYPGTQPKPATTREKASEGLLLSRLTLLFCLGVCDALRIPGQIHLTSQT